MNWYVRVIYNRAATEEQASAFARDIGQTFVDTSRDRTEIVFYTLAQTIGLAASSAINTLRSYAYHMRFEATMVHFEAKSKEERLTELALAGITEDSVS